MIFGVKTEHSPVIDKFVEEFNHPSLNKELITSMIYIEHKAEWVKDVLVFRRKGFYDFLFKYGIIFSLGIIFFGMFMDYTWLITSGFVTMFLCIAVLSPLVFYLSLALRMFFKGHKKSITLVSSAYLLELLFNERDNNEVRTE